MEKYELVLVRTRDFSIRACDGFYSSRVEGDQYYQGTYMIVP